MLGPGPLLPADLRGEHRPLRVQRQPFEVAAVAVDPGLHPDLRRMVLWRDLDPQRADPAVGHARAAHRVQSCPAALGVLEDGGPRQEPVPQVQRAVVGDDRAGVDVEAHPIDDHGGVHPVRGVDQINHRDVVPVVDTGQERARQLAQVALLQASPGAEPTVPDREQGFVEVRPLPIEPGLLHHPHVGGHLGSIAHSVSPRCRGAGRKRVTSALECAAVGVGELLVGLRQREVDVEG